MRCRVLVCSVGTYITHAPWTTYTNGTKTKVHFFSASRSRRRSSPKSAEDLELLLRIRRLRDAHHLVPPAAARAAEHVRRLLVEAARLRDELRALHRRGLPRWLRV